MKIISHPKLLPSGKEITPLGREVIKQALRRPGRILIDVKHMSLKARKEYYRILRTDFPNENIPVIASHAAVTGTSYQNIKAFCQNAGDPGLIKVRYVMPSGHIAGTRFNPSSINLYDEEIDIIIRSGGIIGLNFDERLLGIKKRNDPDPTEYFSKAEVSCSDFTEPLGGAEAAEEELSLLEQRIDELESTLETNLESFLISICDDPGSFRNNIEMWRRIRNSFRELQRLRLREERPLLKFERAINHLCNNILHIALAGGSAAWKHICIGSDFDGLINSLEVCRNARKYRSLSEALKIWLPISAGHNAPAYHITDIDSQVDDIMFGNAFRFLQNNFN
jgi:microsomal dipeptidase-like Zn-dependent dipeptidase